jgi:hypothetical protein
MKFTDTRLSRGKKNEETPITTLDEDKGGFVHIGKQVHAGYYDFESEQEYNDADIVADVIEEKLSEINDEWLDKAGVDLE